MVGLAFGMPLPSLPLNEGRGRDPGDTRVISWKMDGSNAEFRLVAQRRPGPRPRRHTAGTVPGRPATASCARSTKAGAETPATHMAGNPAGLK